jgi:hypothetical protein
LSRLLAVPITLKPLRAWASLFSSWTGSVFSERMVISVSCTSAEMRVNSSIRAILPSSIARSIGLTTSAAGDGPSVSSRA